MGVPNSKDFPYEIGERICNHGVWSLCKGKKKSDASPASIFSFSCSSLTHESVGSAKSDLKQFKTLRHPKFVKYLDGVEDENPSVGANFYVVTESVVPLTQYIRESRPTDDEILWGLKNIADGLQFLNQSGITTFSQLGPSGVMVDSGGVWKILVAKSGPGSPSGFGEIVNAAFGGRPAPRALAIGPRQNAWEVMARVVSGNKFVQMMSQLEDLAVMSPTDRGSFLSSLTEFVHLIPSRVASGYVLPSLQGAVVYGAAREALPCILAIVKGDADLAAKCLPSLAPLFQNPEKAIRMALLNHLDALAPHLSVEAINGLVYPAIASGFSDPEAAFRETCIKAVLHIVGKLSEKIVKEDVLRHLWRLQGDPEPILRTNTTLCLAKMAPSLSEQVRQKFLVAAFTRGLRDPFPAARCASLMALAATQEYHTAVDCALKIIPAISPFTIDPDIEVRSVAVECLIAMANRIAREAPPKQSQVQPQPSTSQPPSMTSSTPTAVSGSQLAAKPVANQNGFGVMGNQRIGGVSTAPTSPMSKLSMADDLPHEEDTWGDESWDIDEPPVITSTKPTSSSSAFGYSPAAPPSGLGGVKKASDFSAPSSNAHKSEAPSWGDETWGDIEWNDDDEPQPTKQPSTFSQPLPKTTSPMFSDNSSHISSPAPQQSKPILSTAKPSAPAPKPVVTSLPPAPAAVDFAATKPPQQSASPASTPSTPSSGLSSSSPSGPVKEASLGAKPKKVGLGAVKKLSS